MRCISFQKKQQWTDTVWRSVPSHLAGEGQGEGAAKRCSHHRLADARGFTLIELVVTVAIVAILALGAIPLVQLAAQRAKEQDLRAALRDIRSAIDAYKKAADEGRVEKKADTSGYPAKLDILADGVKDAKSPDGKKIYFLRRIPRDPFFEDAAVAAEKTWGLRSYASPPDEPKPGDDVFDVYSLSKQKGLNGVPYKDW